MNLLSKSSQKLTTTDSLFKELFSSQDTDKISVAGILGFGWGGFSWPQFLVGSQKADTLTGKAGTQIVLGLDGNDTVDGGAGSDLVIAGRGTDTAIYKAAENKGAGFDYYDGGSGADTLRLVLTSAEWQQAGIRQDVNTYLDFLTSPAGLKGGAFTFSAFALVARSFEAVEVVVDGVVVDPRGGPAPNSNPVATNDAATTNEDTAVTVSVLANDSDPNGDALNVASASAANGTVVINVDKTLTYTPNANFNGADTISYTINDGKGGTASATVAVAVAALNDQAAISGVTAGSVAEDGTLLASGSLTVTDVDTGENRVQAQSGTSGTYGSFSISAAGAWTYSLNNNAANVQALTNADVVTDSFTVTSQDGTATQTVVVTVNGADDQGAPPVVVLPPAVPAEVDEDNAVIISGIAVDIPGVADAVVNTAVSATHGSVALTVLDGITFTDGDGSDGTLAFFGTESAVNNALAHSIAFTPDENYNGPAEVTVTFDDGGANPTGVPQTISTVVSLDVKPVNDPPVIGGGLTGDVTEDQVLGVTGALSANDPDAGLDFVWSIVGGTPTSDANYEFFMDSFRVVRNGQLFFEDQFDFGDPPPDVTGHGGVSLAGYATNGPVQEVGGRLLLSSESAGGAVGAGTDASFVVNAVTHTTSIDSADLVTGLKSDDNVTIEGTFDLSNLPDSPFESFGIRFMDRVLGGANPQAGDDVVEIRVVASETNRVGIVMTTRDFTTDTSALLQSIPLNPPAGADQITLRLSYNPSGIVSGSFDYLDAGVIVGHQDFTATEQIFNGESWTRPQFFAWAPGTSDASLTGDYGVLTLNQSGAWSYALDNESAAVQALTSADTVVDTFDVRLMDTDGSIDIKTISINVHGTNELLI